MVFNSTMMRMNDYTINLLFGAFRIIWSDGSFLHFPAPSSVSSVHRRAAATFHFSLGLLSHWHSVTRVAVDCHYSTNATEIKPTQLNTTQPNTTKYSTTQLLKLIRTLHLHMFKCTLTPLELVPALAQEENTCIGHRTGTGSWPACKHTRLSPWESQRQDYLHGFKNESNLRRAGSQCWPRPPNSLATSTTEAAAGSTTASWREWSTNELVTLGQWDGR